MTMHTNTFNLRKYSWLLLAVGLLSAGLCGNLCAQDPVNPGGKKIQAKKFTRLMKKKNTVLLDVRTEQEYKEGHIPGSIQVDVLQTGDFNTKIGSLEKNKTYLVYCRSGKRSAQAIQIMQQAGFRKLYDLEGGFSKWTGAREQ